MILQVPIPGGPELIVILLVLLMNVAFLAVPALIAVLVYRWWTDDDEDEVAELRERVAALEQQVGRGGWSRGSDDGNR